MKKKVLFVMSRMSVGGSQKSLVNALRNFDFEKYDVSLYVRDNKTDMLGDIPKDVKITVNTNPKKYKRNFYAVTAQLFKKIGAAKVYKSLEKKASELTVLKKSEYEKKHYGVLNEEYDIAVSYLQGYTCRFTADYTTAKRKICFYHNSTDSTPELHREYLKKFEKIVTVSEGTRSFLAERYSDIKERFTVIQNIMDTEDIRKKALEKPLDKTKTVLCSCGRFSPEKGYDLACNAAKILKDRGIDFKWYFVGDGEKRRYIEEYISENGLEDMIEITGFKDNPYPYIINCDIFVQPSYEEAQPLSVLEAHILYKPVVSTDTVGGRTTVVNGETGILCKISSEGIAEGVMQLLNNPALSEKISENIKKLDYEKNNVKIREQWEKLLSGTL